VHGLSVAMDLDVKEGDDAGVIDFIMSGEVPGTNAKERIMQRFLGAQYSYSMRYADGCLGLLTTMEQVRWLPPLHMVYAYKPLLGGRTAILPIYVTAKREGPIGWLKSQFLLTLTRLTYYFLRGEDGQIYDNIRFAPNALLPIDAPLRHYMNYVNQLSPSCWSREVDDV
jgi:hypothetical protein